jgi:HPt (histidine-containing phosphotransfer) domain-containing protein
MENPKCLPVSAVGATFDPAVVVALLEGDNQLLAEIVQMIRAESPRTMSEIRRCVEASDPDGVERIAHRLRGAVSLFAAHTISEAVLELEMMGRRRTLTEASPKLAELERQLDHFDRDLAKLSQDIACEHSDR